MTIEHFNSLGLTMKEYYYLPPEEKLEHNKKYTYNPFDERIRRGELPLITMGSLDLDGPWTDGFHLISGPFNFNFNKKIEVKNNIVIRVWGITEDYEWDEKFKTWI